MTVVQSPPPPEPPAAAIRVRRRRRRPGSTGRPRLLAAVLVLALLVAASVDALRVVRVGPVTGLGLATVAQIALAGLALLASHVYPRPLLRRLAPFGALLGWTLVTTLWYTPTVGGAQNALVYLHFGLLLLAAGTAAGLARETTERVIDRSVLVLTAVALGLAVANIGPKGWPQSAPRGAGWWYVNPRPYALMALVPLGWHLARWYHGRRWDVAPAALLVAAIFASLSRTATATALLTVAAVVALHLRLKPRAQSRWQGRAAVVERILLAAVPAAAIAGAVYFQPFNERLVERERQTAGGVSADAMRVKDSGRLEIWGATLASVMKAPTLGQGLGSSEIAISQAMPEVGHPHNDYLRVWHDLGLPGLVLLLASLGGWARALWRDWGRARASGASDAGRPELAGLLALAGLMLGMVTDNSLVYSFVAAPAAVIVGAGLGAGAATLPAAPRRRRRRRSTRVSD